jgi:hypothetical protein
MRSRSPAAATGEIVNACTVQIPLGQLLRVLDLHRGRRSAFTPSGALGKTTLFEHEVWDEEANARPLRRLQPSKERHIRTI